MHVFPKIDEIINIIPESEICRGELAYLDPNRLESMNRPDLN